MYPVLKMSLNDYIQDEVPKGKKRLAPGLHQGDCHSALGFLISKVMNIFESSYFFSASKNQINENKHEFLGTREFLFSD